MLKQKQLNCFLIALLSWGIHAPMLAASQAEAPADVPALQQTDREQLQDQLEALHKQALQQLNGIDNVVEDLALLTSKNQITKDATLKKELVGGLTTLRETIDQLRAATKVSTDIQTIYLLLSINNALINHISTALANNLKSMPAFDLAAHIDTVLATPLSPEKMEQLLTENTTAIQKLSQQAHNAGLRWYNKVTRGINTYVLEPLNTYKIPKILLTSGSLYFLYLWYTDSPKLDSLRWLIGKQPGLDATGRPIGEKAEAIGEKVMHNNTSEAALSAESMLQPFSSEHAPQTQTLSTASQTTQKSFKLLEHLETTKIKLDRGLMPLGSVALTFATTAIQNEASAGLKWTKNHVQRLWNKLLGGVYAERQIDEFIKKNPTATFDSIVGCNNAKSILKGVIKYIEDPERFDRTGLSVERGYLLIGPPRTGKSFMAEALAGEIQKVLKQQGRSSQEFGFYTIQSSQIIKYGIKPILQLAKKEAPCILFIDEIDLLALQRVGGDRDLLSEFLVAMSGCLEKDPDHQVIIIAATNNPQNIDKALKQPGRFGKIIRFEHPNLDDRVTFLRKKLASFAVNMNAFDVEGLAHKTEGCSFDHLDQILRKALQQAKTTGALLDQQLLDDALDTEIRNIIFKEGKELSDEEKATIAAYQAGQALAYTLLTATEMLDKVTIRPVLTEIKEEALWDTYSKKDPNSDEDDDKQQHIQYGKIFTYKKSDSLNICSPTEKAAQCKIALAGYAAEKVLLGSSSYSYRNDDKQHAYNLIKPIVFEGLQEQQYSKEERQKRYDVIARQLAQYEKEVVDLFEQHKNELHALMLQLKEKEILTHSEIKDITSQATNTEQQAQ